MSTNIPAPLLDTPEAAKFLKVAPATLERLRLEGGGPEYVKLARAVRYRPEDLGKWIKTRLRRSTSDRT